MQTGEASNFPPGLTLGERIVSALVSAGCLTVLIVAAVLKPSPTGITTHGGLGLPPCGWEAATGYPCMTCGMTTSFSWAVRCNFRASLWVQPFGTVLVVLCAVVFWAGLYATATGNPIHRALSAVRMRSWTILFGGLGLAAWMWKIYIHRSGLDGWP